MSENTRVQFRCATGRIPGAIAVVDVIGPSLDTFFCKVISSRPPTPEKIALTSFLNADGSTIDTGMVMRATESCVQLMPHGGPRVMQRLLEALTHAGAEPCAVESVGHDELSIICDLWPESKSIDEALMLECLSIAQSPLATSLLLEQPARWAAYRKQSVDDRESLESMKARAMMLNRLVHPPRIVLVGPPNVGKSTLLNALMGRETAITSASAGTTRDYVGAQLDLGGLAVWWFDTAGKRATDDAIEAEAIRLTDHLITHADLLIEATSPDSCPRGRDNSDMLSQRIPDLRIQLKADLANDDCDDDEHSPIDVHVCAQHDDENNTNVESVGLELLTTTIREYLVPQHALDHPGPWLFDERLQGH